MQQRNPYKRLSLLILIGISGCLLGKQRASADVVVIANRTQEAISFRTVDKDERFQTHRIVAGGVLTIPTVGKLDIVYRSSQDRQPQRFSLGANEAYFFGQPDARPIRLEKIGLGGNDTTALGTGVTSQERLAKVGVIPVKILVDEDEPATRQRWESRLRTRFDYVSEIFERSCRVRFKIVEVATWESDNRIKKFVRSLRELEEEVPAGKSRLVIGFTNQYELLKDPKYVAKGFKLGGTRGPLHSHILIREHSPKISEAERLEVLVHEIGHFLGAVHSPEGNSVMRPVLGDRKARAASFRIEFDPVNLLAINLVAEELRDRRINTVQDLTSATTARLRQLYAAIDQALPEDPAAKNYIGLLNSRIITDARYVLKRVTQAAAENAALPVGGTDRSEPQQRTGDELTEYYVRRAAYAARELPPDRSRSAFLLGLGIALDDGKILRAHHRLGKIVEAIETEKQRQKRLSLLGKPTIFQRQDLARHFFVSMYLTAVAGTQTAAGAGLAKELSDMEGTSGFSFVDMAANKSGIYFAAGILKGRFSLRHVAEQFTVKFYMPAVDQLPEGLNKEKFLKEFGSVEDGRYFNLIKHIDSRIGQLPPYRAVLDSLVPLKEPR